MNRHEVYKLAAGGWSAFLFTALVFGPMGFGRRYVDRLQRQVRADLDAHRLDDVDVAVLDTPSLRRVMVLSGKVSASDRRAAMQISQNVSGVADVRWSATESAANGYSSRIAGRDR